jgi:hypothetical protein
MPSHERLPMNAPHLHGWGGHPTAVRRPSVSTHMSEDLKEGRIRTTQQPDNVNDLALATLAEPVVMRLS